MVKPPCFSALFINSRWLIFFRGKEAQLLAEDLRQGCGLVQRSSRRWRFYILLPGVLHTYIYIYMYSICAGLALVINDNTQIYIMFTYILMLSTFYHNIYICVCVCVRSKVNPHSFRIASAFKNAFDFVARRSS